jgi:hypothetical protein
MKVTHATKAMSMGLTTLIFGLGSGRYPLQVALYGNAYDVSLMFVLESDAYKRLKQSLGRKITF